MELEQRQTKTD